MTFAAYQSRGNGTDFSFEGRDEAAGILGTFRTGGAVPVVTAHTLEELEQAASAYLGKEPDGLLYLTDGEGRVHRMLINEKHHEAIAKAQRHTAIAVAIAVFSVTCLIGASFAALGAWALLAFVGASALYTLFLRTGFFNAIEGAVICELFLILTLTSIPLLVSLGYRLPCVGS